MKSAQAPPARREDSAYDGDVLCLRAFLTFADFESHFLTFKKRAVTFRIDLTEMNEYVRTAFVSLNKPVTFFLVEPFNSTVDKCHN